MNRPRLARSLRITWTAFWGTAAILLIVLCVRSYWRGDYLKHFESANTVLRSFAGDFWKPPFAAPHLLIAVLCLLLAAAASIRRYNLRALLIATTLVAVALGIIVVMYR